MKKSYNGLSLKDALLIKSAQFWLLLGEPAEAVSALQQLTRRSWQNAWARAVFRCAARQFGSDGQTKGIGWDSKINRVQRLALAPLIKNGMKAG